MSRQRACGRPGRQPACLRARLRGGMPILPSAGARLAWGPGRPGGSGDFRERGGAGRGVRDGPTGPSATWHALGAPRPPLKGTFALPLPGGGRGGAGSDQQDSPHSGRNGCRWLPPCTLGPAPPGYWLQQLQGCQHVLTLTRCSRQCSARRARASSPRSDQESGVSPIQIPQQIRLSSRAEWRDPALLHARASCTACCYRAAPA